MASRGEDGEAEADVDVTEPTAHHQNNLDRREEKDSAALQVGVAYHDQAFCISSDIITI